MHTFDTPGPTTLDLRTGAGAVTVTAAATTTTTVTLTALNDAGHDAVERARVEQRGDRVVVDVPRRPVGLLRSGPRVAVEVELPEDSVLLVQADSADITARGSFADATASTGSGDLDLDDVAGRAVLKSGSGRITVGTGGDHLRATTGSGTVSVERTARSSVVSLGSGDISLGEVVGEVVTKTGSGDLDVGVLDGDLSAKTGSGRVTVRRASAGRLRSSGASGDVSVGIPEGTAAWLDLSTVNGRVRQELGESSGPAEGQRRVEISGRTVSGDIWVHRS